MDSLWGGMPGPPVPRILESTRTHPTRHPPIQPAPPFWEPLIREKKLSFILHFRPLGTFLVFTNKLKFCHYFYIYFWE